MANFWETDRIRLRQHEPDDWRIHHEWDMDTETVALLDELHFPKSTIRSQQWAENAAKNPPQNDNVSMAIIRTSDEAYLGIIAPNHANRRHGTFDYGIAISPEYQRHGYAQEAISLVMRYFFNELRYQKCTPMIHSNNTPSIALHQKMGFIEEGRLRRMIYTGGTYHDLLYFGMTLEEWREQYDS